MERNHKSTQHQKQKLLLINPKTETHLCLQLNRQVFKRQDSMKERQIHVENC